MSERPDESSGLTPGDPLAGPPEPPRQPPPPPPPAPEQPPATSSGGLWGAGDPRSGPPATAPGYTSPPPPGAGGLAQAPQAGSPGGRYELASWGTRAAAQVIDGFIVFVGAIVLVAVFGAIFSVGFIGGNETGIVALIVGLLLWFVAVAIISLLYAPTLMARTNGQTLGRQLMKIRVVRTSGEPITFGFAVIREVVVKALLVGVVASFTAGIAYLLDILWPLWDEENRALHDFVVNTRTVKA
jgi:uncharacterized RDD family membrane protein YckC